MCPGLQVQYFPMYKSNGCISQPHLLKLQVDILLICCLKPEFKILIILLHSIVPSIKKSYGSSDTFQIELC